MNVDTVAPTVEISGLSGTSGAVTVTITFSEDVTGFTVGDIAVSNGVASDFAGSGATYTARITPTDGGMVTSLVIAAGVAVDAANNGNKRATANNATVSRLAAPAPLTATPGDGQVTLGWTVTADNAGFAAATRYRYRYLGRGVTPEWRDVPDNDGDGDLSDETSHVVAGLTNDVNYLFQVLAVNAAGLGSPASITAMPSATVDSTAPTVISIKRQTPSTSPTNADSLTWRVTFSEAVMGVDGADFTITGSTASATAADSSASTVWDVTASGGDLETLDGTVTLGFASGQHIDDAIVDASGNPLDATLPAGAETTYTVDNTPDRPTGADRTVTTEEDTAYAFTAGDFGFVDADEGDTLAGIRITALETAGALKFSADVTLDQVISKSQIDTGLLTFTPAANANGPGYATFGFKVSDGTLESAAANTITIDVTAVNDAPTGLPAIAGIAGVPSEGDTLTAATDAIADADGLGTFGYQWKRDGTAIAGATSSTYTLAQADVGSAITVTVSWTDDGGTAESVTSAPTEMVTPAPLTVTITTGLEVRETAGPVTATITFSAAVTGFAETDLAVVFGTLSEFTEVTSGTVWTVVLTPNPNFNGQSVSLTVPAGVAVDANGNGNKRAETSVRYLAPLKAPATFTLTPGDTQLTLAWTAPANDGKGLAALIKYQYQYHRSGAPWVWWKDVPDSDGDKDLSDETGLVLTGLDNGQRYHFQLRALNGAGVGVSTAIISAVPSASAANAAPAFASDTLTRSVAENSASGTNVGAAIPAATDTDNDSLTYTMEGTDAASFAFDASTRQITTTSGVDYDHETKSSYSVTVKADDGNGGTDTVAVTITVSDVNEPPAAPGAPTVSATAGSTTGLDVAWTAPSNTGKPAISSYDLRYRAGSSGDWTNGPQDVATTSSALTGLTAGTSYQVQVRATNAEGDSGWSAAGSGTTNSPANTAPVFADTTLTRSVAENSASGTNVGAAVPAATDTDNDSLTYTMEGTDAASFAFDASTRQITTTSGVDYDHETKSSYSVTVKADDGNGGTDTVAVTITVSDVNEPPAAPGAPTVSATAGSTTGLDVAWTAPSNTGKPAISSYDLRYRAGSSGDWTNGPQDVATTSSALTGLTAGTSHQVQVRATNAEGDSGWSASGSGTTGTPANRTPVVNNMIPDQTATEGTAFSYAFPSNTFSDPDTGDTLTYTAVLSDDSALPSWLTFTGSTRTFSGTPAAADAGALAVKVTASDGSLSAEDTFTLTVNALPVLSIALPSVEGLSRNMAGQQVYEETGGPGGLTLSFDVSLTPAPSAAQSVCVRVTETGGSRIASTDKGVRTVSVPTTGSTALSLTWTDTAADDADSTITVEAVAPSDTACSQTGYTVSATDGSDEALVVDDDPTTVELTGSDLSMFEGDASDTAVLTVTLGRQLAAGEVVVAPLVLASTTGARLPGSTDGGGDPDNDFTVSVSGTGVTVSGADSANPTLTFTGHDTNTVQTATVTLAPVDSRDDGDSADEAITARLASNSVLSASGTGTNVGGGASRHATNFQVSVTMIDDEGGGIGLSVSEVRLLENGSTTYTVVLDAEPTSLVLMSMTRKGTHDGAATISPTSHSFIVGDGGNWDQPVTITVSGVDESNQNRNRTLELDHDFDSLGQPLRPDHAHAAGEGGRRARDRGLGGLGVGPRRARPGQEDGAPADRHLDAGPVARAGHRCRPAGLRDPAVEPPGDGGHGDGDGDGGGFEPGGDFADPERDAAGLADADLQGPRPLPALQQRARQRRRGL